MPLSPLGHARRCSPLSGTNRTHSPCGTAGFVAPEVLQHNGYDNAVDLWSLGVVRRAL